ncbi:hypothetical protein ACFWPK_22385 [Nocardia sp. NPDC058519]|uniref:hypothetical protein n=1 Tax=Nocardia sp. NPDC058519 TaxID=3346535 RepID=UPI003660EB2C
MPLPDITTAAALGARLGRTLAGADLARAEAAIADVSALARGIAKQDWPDAPTGVPGEVVAIVLSGARRVFENPGGFIVEARGPITATRAAATVAGSPFTAAETRWLQKLRPRSGLWTLATTRGDSDFETGFVSDSRPGSDPIAYFAAGDPGFDQADHYPGF